MICIIYVLYIHISGGPGCTSMEGATTENGPLSLFDIKESCQGEDHAKCDYTQQLSMNPYSWNAHANVLYLDQPKNVGYSFGYGTETKSSVEAADDFIIFYQNWLTLFPEFVGRKVIIAGESYGKIILCMYYYILYILVVSKYLYVLYILDGFIQ